MEVESAVKSNRFYGFPDKELMLNRRKLSDNSSEALSAFDFNAEYAAVEGKASSKGTIRT